MRIHPQTVLVLTAIALTLAWPAPASAKRAFPTPVPPVTWQGVEYRAPLDVEHMGHILAFDSSTGRALWDTKVYRVWIIPLMEEDVQWVFISSMAVKDNQLLVENEAGKTYYMDLKTGRVESRWLTGFPLFLAACITIGAAFLARLRKRHSLRARVENCAP